MPLEIIDDPGLTINEFSTRVDQLVAKHNTELVVLDYLQIANPDPEMKLFTGYQKVTYASHICRMAARRHGIRSIALSQLSRPPDRRKPGLRPTLSDLRESGAIEQDAAAVGFVHRPEMWDKDNDSLKGKAEIIFDKTRFGSLCTCHLRWNGAHFRFSEPDAQPPHAYGSAEDKEDQQFPT